MISTRFALTCRKRRWHVFMRCTIICTSGALSGEGLYKQGADPRRSADRQLLMGAPPRPASRTVCMGLLLFLELAAKASSAAPIDPSVMAICSQDRKVRSLARKVLGSSRCAEQVMGDSQVKLLLRRNFSSCCTKHMHARHRSAKYRRRDQGGQALETTCLWDGV